MRTKQFLENLEHDRIAKAIAAAEAKTSGEIRVFIQRGEVTDAIAAARERFEALGMTQTAERNAVLIFIAPRAQKFAVIGDKGIHEKCGDSFWQVLTAAMRGHFQAQNFTDAVVHAIAETGGLLARHFPRGLEDRNELSDIVEES